MTVAARLVYAGIATRAVGLALDAALSQLIVLGGAASMALIASLVGGIRFVGLAKLLGAVAWVVVVVVYFVFFWSTAGQTPGMRVMGLRVLDDAEGGPPTVWRALLRFVGLVLAIIPLFAGFLPILVDNRRRGVQDFLGRTVVVYE